MPGYMKVGRLDDFPEGVIRRFAVLGSDVAVVHWHDRFFAFGDACTHWGISLKEGYITKDDEICCIYHAAVFDMASGKVLQGPADEDLTIFKVHIEGDDVFVGRDSV